MSKLDWVSFPREMDLSRVGAESYGRCELGIDPLNGGRCNTRAEYSVIGWRSMMLHVQKRLTVSVLLVFALEAERRDIEAFPK